MPHGLGWEITNSRAERCHYVVIAFDEKERHVLMSEDGERVGILVRKHGSMHELYEYFTDMKQPRYIVSEIHMSDVGIKCLSIDKIHLQRILDMDRSIDIASTCMMRFGLGMGALGARKNLGVILRILYAAREDMVAI